MSPDEWGFYDKIPLALQTAVRVLVEGKGTTAERLEKATYPLATLCPEDFPEHLRGRASSVLDLRGKYVFHAGNESYFHKVKPTDRVRFSGDLLALYEACLIDLGRTWPKWEFMYPTERDGALPSSSRW